MDLSVKQLATLTRYAERRISRAKAAARRRMSERQVDREVQVRGLARARSSSSVARQKALENKLARARAALSAKRKTISIEEAAIRAGVSLRTMYRWVSRLPD